MKIPYVLHRPMFAVAGILSGIAIGFVMNLTYDDAVTQEVLYCEMVAEGTWPNYKNLECAE